ncbi:CU044_2847 family protein [Crocosphaera sp.]|uniref:CU044_2847 family protein n=1 Tax=Crocosphaera sp. TaxID=2729996 RepID=UPI00262AFAA0|nr:CU044_2847 family protein [Crocosphaera sp.]MDJ0578599.1 CU044_2847 family protein [Crocosphaera sp.]
MKPLIKYSLDGDDSILVEVEELPTSEVDEGLVANYPGQQVVVQAQTSFADAMDKIKPVAANIIGKVRELKDSPDEIEVKFGVKMTAEMGAIIASANVEGNYEITLKWKK